MGSGPAGHKQRWGREAALSEPSASGASSRLRPSVAGQPSRPLAVLRGASDAGRTSCGTVTAAPLHYMRVLADRWPITPDQLDGQGIHHVVDVHQCCASDAVGVERRSLAISHATPVRIASDTAACKAISHACMLRHFASHRYDDLTRDRRGWTRRRLLRKHGPRCRSRRPDAHRARCPEEQ